ncbi:transcriptional regulator NrdR [Acidiferrobacter sp.]|jgi:transcriptional repressor NrdR|uniref:transcriptional regulator NrdR n=1 Tax=Acidiferrobacter sp. TaxID=1872107 RepID=UPI002617ECD0|nr:transcriptional regulator NrdR [Acidiferrobacter sp.]
MRCPFCFAEDTRVIDSRLADEGDAVRRRRECLACRERFTTFEHAELRLPQIIKSDGRREPFAEAKLRAGLQRALQKRPVDAAQVDAVVAYVRRSLMGSGEREVGSRQIGEWVMEQLRALDKVAYVRFASVYHAFQDLNAFREEMERLEDQEVTGLSSKS